MSEWDCDVQTMELEASDVQTMELEALVNSAPIDTCEKEVMQMACHKDITESPCEKEAMQTACHKDITESPWDPSHLFRVHEKFDLEKMGELLKQRSVRMAKALPNDIIIPDPTPKFVQEDFYDMCHKLVPVLKKDSVRCFLSLFAKYPRAMSWNLSITSETLTCIVGHDALRCAKAVLEGKMHKLHFLHANPNCMNPHGYFPIHEAAERFSVDMIKLLFRHGASANVRTVGNAVIEDLLPLHVAVENTCMHKYLEDNLSPTQYHRDDIYKLIYLLCLPEMKIFLDTIRLLAEKTDNLLDELWKCIKKRELVQTSLLLLAAQKQIRKHEWFNTIMYRIFRETAALGLGSDNDGARKQLEETFHLVSIISHAGEALDKYVQAHSEVPHVEVLEHISSILKEFGFSPKRDIIDVKNLRPYNCKISTDSLHGKGLVHAKKELTEMSYLHAVEEKVLRKKVTGGWDPTYTRRSFFPYWRSVLGTRCKVRVYPSYAAADDKTLLNLELARKRMSNGPSSSSSDIGLIGRIQQLTSTHQSRKYCTGAFKTLAKVLKNA
ncbi:unnamed protein product [Urochloa decumbens]|uniref:Uncharacterized protein n=2 Tax=Urochloa decumbens TaxID=240449 RepID=A0ABC9FEY5_9POAL